MNFKPDIDFTPLLTDGTMGLAELRTIFGRDVTSGDIEHCRSLFKTKHPNLWQQLKCSRRNGLGLRTQAEASIANARGQKSAMLSLVTRTAKLATQRVDEMTAEQRNEHTNRVASATGESITLLTKSFRQIPRVGA